MSLQGNYTSQASLASCTPCLKPCSVSAENVAYTQQTLSCGLSLEAYRIPRATFRLPVDSRALANAAYTIHVQSQCAMWIFAQNQVVLRC